MPVVFRHGPYKFFFYSNEGDLREPVHVHVRSGHAVATIWIEPELGIADAHGFDARTLRAILDIVRPETGRITRAWHEHFR
jgi:Domain of unknown function (DUF4160)